MRLGSILAATRGTAAWLRAQVLVADFEQAVERGIDHLVIEQFLAVVVGADAEIAVGARQHVAFEPGLIVLKGANDGLVGGFEFGAQVFVGDLLEGLGHIVLKEAGDARQLLDGHLGIDFRRIVEILARRLEDARDQALARDDRFQAVFGGRESAAHDGEDGAGDARRIEVRILLPGADGFEGKQLGADLGQRQFAVRDGPRGEAARDRSPRPDARTGGRRRLADWISARERGQQGIVLVKARLGSRRGIVAEDHFVEEAVGQAIELGIAVLREADGAQCENEEEEPHDADYIGRHGERPSVARRRCSFRYRSLSPRTWCWPSAGCRDSAWTAPGAAIIGAALMLAANVLTVEEAYAAIDYDTILLLFGMMIVVANLRLSGFFALVSGWVVDHTHRPLLLLAGIVLVSGVFSAFFVNDTMCLVLTPLVLEITRRQRRNPVPYLVAVAMAANIGSTATITGNPQNMMIGSFSHIGYRTFAAALAPIAAVGLALTVGVVALVYRAEFRGEGRMEVEHRPARVHRALMIKSLATSGAMIVGFFVGWPVAKVAVVAGALLLLTRRVKPERIYREIDWSLLVMFIGLFIVLAGVEKTALAADFFAAASRYHLERTGPLTVATALLSNLVSNVPAVLVFKGFVTQASAAGARVADAGDGVDAGGQSDGAGVGGQPDCDRAGAARGADRLLGIRQGGRAADRADAGARRVDAGVSFRFKEGVLLDNGIDDGGGPSGQGLSSGFCSVYLQDIGGDAHNVLVVGETGLLE